MLTVPYVLMDVRHLTLPRHWQPKQPSHSPPSTFDPRRIAKTYDSQCFQPLSPINECLSDIPFQPAPQLPPRHRALRRTSFSGALNLPSPFAVRPDELLEARTNLRPFRHGSAWTQLDRLHECDDKVSSTCNSRDPSPNMDYSGNLYGTPKPSADGNYMHHGPQSLPNGDLSSQHQALAKWNNLSTEQILQHQTQGQNRTQGELDGNNNQQYEFNDGKNIYQLDAAEKKQQKSPSDEGQNSYHTDSSDVPPSDSGIQQDISPSSQAKALSEQEKEWQQQDRLLGPLPPNWERAVTEQGEVYFIDHETETSHWLDPRLSRIQKRDPAECEDNELPYGWERIDDPHYGTYYIDHVRRRTQYENPVIVAKRQLARGGAQNGPSSAAAFFTRDPSALAGDRIQCELVKSPRGLGFTIVGGDDGVDDEFLQIKSIVPDGPAWRNGLLKTGDVLVSVNNTCVLGFTHQDMVKTFQSLSVGQHVHLEVCRGYPLPFDPEDPNTEIVTTLAVDKRGQSPATMPLPKHEPSRSVDETAQRRPSPIPPTSTSSMATAAVSTLNTNQRMLHYKRPSSASDLLSSSRDMRTGGHDVREASHRAPTPRPGQRMVTIVKGKLGFGFTLCDSETQSGTQIKRILDEQMCSKLDIRDGDHLLAIDGTDVSQMNHDQVVQVMKLCRRNAEVCLILHRHSTEDDLGHSEQSTTAVSVSAPTLPSASIQSRSKTPTAELLYAATTSRGPTSSSFVRNDRTRSSSRHDYLESSGSLTRSRDSQHAQQMRIPPLHPSSATNEQFQGSSQSGLGSCQTTELTVNLQRQDTGFGFRIVGGTEEGSQVSVGHIVPGGAADLDGRLFTGDQIVAINGRSVMNWSHHEVVDLMGRTAVDNGQVVLTIRRRTFQPASYDVVVSRRAKEGFGFVIISSGPSQSQLRPNNSSSNVVHYGSTIGRIIADSPAARATPPLRVGDHILAVNGVPIDGLHHGQIVQLIKDSGYRVIMTVACPSQSNDSQDGHEMSRPSHGDSGWQSSDNYVALLASGQRPMRSHTSLGSEYSSTAVQRDHPVSACFAVELRRSSSTGYGFSIRGGLEFDSMPLFVLRIASDGQAAKDGRLQVGDELIEINGQTTRDAAGAVGMTHATAIQLIKSGFHGDPAVVKLVVVRRPSGTTQSASFSTASLLQQQHSLPSSMRHGGLGGSLSSANMPNASGRLPSLSSSTRPFSVLADPYSGRRSELSSAHTAAVAQAGGPIYGSR